MLSRSEYHRFNKYKVLRHSDKLAQIAEGAITAPVEWIIYPANVCGYRCAHCIMAEEQQLHRRMLTHGAMLRVPEDAVRHGIHVVIFSGGGDPLLNRMTMPTAYELKRRGVKVGINNQGYLLNDPQPFDFVRFSVDAATRETYERIHRFDGWDRVVGNIRRLADMRKAGDPNELGLAFLITPSNWHETEQFCEWAQQFSPTFVHLRPAFLDAPYLDKEYPGGDKALREEVVPRLSEVGRRMEQQYHNVFFRVDKFEGYWTPKLYSKCRATPLIAVTSGDGAFLVCQDRGITAGDEHLRWGDYNRQTFEEIWWGQEHRDVLERIDLDRCPRCVENGYNEIIEHAFINDGLRASIL